jgi:hypothetical protein
MEGFQVEISGKQAGMYILFIKGANNLTMGEFLNAGRNENGAD